MNVIKHYKIIIEGDVWEPQEKECQRELSDLCVEIRARRLLAHFGNVKILDEHVVLKETDKPNEK